MDTRIGRIDEAVVIARHGCVRRAGGSEAALLLDGAVPFEVSGLEHRAHGEAGPCPAVVSVSLELGPTGPVTDLAARFVRGRVGSVGATVVLRTSSGVARARGCWRGLAELAAIPVGALAERGEIDLAVVVGEPHALRYASPEATVVVGRDDGAPALVAALLSAHRRFMGAGHCAGDARLVAMAASGIADPAGIRAALAEHEAAVVAELMADAVLAC